MSFYKTEPKKPAPKNVNRLHLSGERSMGDILSYWEFDESTIAEMIVVLKELGERYGEDCKFKRIDHYDEPDELMLIINERDENDIEYAARQLAEANAWDNYERNMKSYREWSIENNRRNIEDAKRKLAKLEKDFINDYGKG